MRWSLVLLATSLCGSASAYEHSKPSSAAAFNAAAFNVAALNVAASNVAASNASRPDAHVARAVWHAFVSPVVAAAIARSRGDASEHGGFKGADDDPGA
jgi:hypothetical protein